MSAAAGYTHSTDERYITGGGGLAGFSQDVDLFQVGASAMHVPSGLFIYGLYQSEDSSPSSNIASGPGFASFGTSTDNNTDVWYLKGGIKRTWSPLGATVLFGEYAEYNDQFGGIKGTDVCAAGGAFNLQGGGVAPVCVANAVVGVTDSTVERWGLGVVQEVDPAAMHLYARWQHLDLDVDLVNGAGASVNQDFESWDVFQIGGVMFF